MKIRIYQITPEEKNRFLLFSGFVETLKNGGINPGNYECVYEAEMPVTNPEEIYRIFNLELPADFHGRSFSVSDIVEFESNGRSEFFFCDSFGFKMVDFDKASVSRTDENRKQK